MNRTILFSILFLIGTTGAFAQNLLKGKVIDATTGKGLEGATISLRELVTTSDKNGSFTIDCNGTPTMVITYVGYQTKKQAIKNCTDEITVSLEAQNKSLEEIEISTTSNQNKLLLYQPVSITKLTPLELKRSTGLFLSDAINGNVPGVQMQSRGVSSGQQFNIRGYGNGVRGTNGLNSNFDGQGYKVYLNGIPITDAEGITTMDDIDFGSIGNIEITKGPTGTLYGLAIAGAVNLKTIKPDAVKTSIGQDILLGSYGLQRTTTHFAMSGEKSSILVNYGHQKTNGYTIHNASHKDFVNFVGDFQPNAMQTVNTYFGYSNSYDERNGEDSVAQYEIGDYTGNLDYIKRDAHSAVYTVRAGVSHAYSFNKNIANTTTVFGTAFNSNASSAGGWTDKATTNFGLRSTLDIKINLKNNFTLSGITGVEIQHQNATTIGYDMIDPLGSTHVWKIGDPYFIIGSANANTINGIRSDIYSTTNTSNLFTEWTLVLKNDLSITAGVGISNIKIGLNDRFYTPAIPNKVRQFDTSYNGLVSPHLALNKVFSKHISGYVSFSSGYKTPVSSYFFIPAVGTSSPTTTFNGSVNSSLKPELGNQIEIGTKGNFLKNKLTYQLAFFDAVFSNKMTVVAVPNPANTVTLYTYVANGGKQDNKGFEASVRYKVFESSKGFIQSITPSANMTYSNFKYKDFKLQTKGKSKVTPTLDSAYTTDYSDFAVAGVPKIVGNLGLDVMTNLGLYFNFTYFYKDAMPLTSNGLVNIGGVSVPYQTSSYSLLNAKIGYQNSISKHFDIDAYFGINNIANTKYPLMVFSNQIPDAYLTGPNKALSYGGVNLKYNF
jgi:iron complex outermembrane recepter protein